MHLYKTMRDFLMDKDYYIDIFEKYIHVFNYVDIIKLESKKIIITMDGFNLEIDGTDLVVKRLEKKEILIEGVVLKVGFIR